MLVYRVREHGAPTPAPFVEYLLVPDDAATSLVLPLELPSRFNGRVLRRDTLRQQISRYTSHAPSTAAACENEIATDDVALDAVAVASASFVGIQHVTRTGIFGGGGVWIVADDCSPRGAFAPAGVAARVQWMGIPISERAAVAIRTFHASVRALAGISEAGMDPLSLYHGTASAAVPAISSAGGLLPTRGMLGEGVYLGTLWKAARFACLTQEYAPRPGSVLRVLCFGALFAQLPRPSWACACARCTGVIDGSTGASAGRLVAASICDHDSVWLRDGCDGAHAHVSDSPAGTCRDGAPRYLLRNEEWVVRPSLVEPTHVADVDGASLSEGGVHYEPLHRGARIR